jgi:signal transduction histidine kinase/ligand-binding sensor domain-containing protein
VKAKGKRRKAKVKRPAANPSLFFRALFIFALCLLPFAFRLPSRSQTETASLHQWGAVTLFHGLPSDQVQAVAQTADGVMWFGTDAGLARYDGRRVQTVTDEGLSGPRVRALAVDAAGTLWVGADGGAYVRAAGAQSFVHVAETTGKSVLAVAPAPGRALLATADGLLFECRQEGDGSLAVRQLGERLTAGKGQPLALTSLAVEGESVVVGTHGRGLLTIDAGGEAKEVLSKPRAYFVESLVRVRDGALYFGAQSSASDSGLFRAEDGRLARPLKVAGGATGTVTALGAAADGDLYAATDGRGVFHYNGGGQLLEHFTFAGTAGGLRSDRVNAVFIDREGVVWFGTPRGVCRYDPRGVRVEQISTDTEGNFVRSLYRTSHGRLLAGTNRGLFAREDAAGAWREVEEVKGKTVYALAEDGAGLLLVGTSGGLYVGLQTEGRTPRSDVKLAPEARAAGGKAEGGGEKVQDKAGTAATSGDDGAGDAAKGGATAGGEKGGAKSDAGKGVGQENDEKVADEESPDAGGASESQSKKSAEPALSGSVRAIARFGEAVYVATFGRGLERFDGPGRRTLVWPRAGHDERGREVVSLYADAGRGRLWVGTANAGVFYFDGREVKREPALAPLEGSTVWGASAGEGWLWLATSRGLYAFREGRALIEVAGGVDARAVNAVAPGGDKSLPRAWCATAGAGVLRVVLDDEFGAVASRLDTEQGLPTDSAFSVLPVAEDDGRASLLFGTTRGLARYEPATLPPVLRLTRVAASRSYQPEELRGGALRLEYPQSSVALDVDASASRTFPEQFQYAFTLLDSRGRTVKQKLSHDSQFQADNLPAGRYRVTARAFALDLTPSDPLVFEFEVARAPFPRTTVALSVLLALALVALAWAYVQHRRIVRSREEVREANRQLAAARLQLASEAESERRRIARDLHDQTLADLRRLLLLTDEMQPGAATQGAAGGVTATPGTLTNAAGGALQTAAAVFDPAALRAEIEAISQEVRRICEDLSPSVLENVGFAAALEFALASALAHLPAERKFAYEFSCDEDLEERLALAPGVQMQVYRIVQEAVSNVCRHARAAHVRLTIRLDDEGLFTLTLEDDGRGFDAGNRKALKGRGLAGIRARASLIEAEAEWQKREGGGTAFVLRKRSARKKETAD